MATTRLTSRAFSTPRALRRAQSSSALRRCVTADGAKPHYPDANIRAIAQWFDWMLPEAWNIEHNNLHHYRLGEQDDPDLVERNLAFTRDLKAPMAVKYAIVAFLACTWKWFYYSPNTYKELKIMERKKLGLPVTKDMAPHDAFTMKVPGLSSRVRAFSSSCANLVVIGCCAQSDCDYYPMLRPEVSSPQTLPSATDCRPGCTPAFVDRYIPGMKITMWYPLRDFFAKVAGPYLAIHFFLMPAPALLISTAAYWNCVATLFIADVVTNIHSFIIIATNHAGSDLYKFEQGCKPNSGTFYMRQVVSSANFRTGGDWNDFWHGWLNYQIEHHVWPSLSALSYQKSQPELKAICEKHGVPYVQESVWVRLKKTVDIMVGKADMRPFPAWAEKESDLKVWSAADTSENSARLGQDVKVVA